MAFTQQEMEDQRSQITKAFEGPTLESKSPLNTTIHFYHTTMPPLARRHLNQSFLLLPFKIILYIMVLNN